MTKLQLAQHVRQPHERPADARGIIVARTSAEAPAVLRRMRADELDTLHRSLHEWAGTPLHG